ncbi:MAG: DNA-processing protein DprA [Spirochaetaceae bacterium]|jgi:DNA processing protein|nr:DNA-processing protein DprA [Spirochaetaceae bacterium]
MSGIDREKLLSINRIEKDSSFYPPLLREIFDPPLFLYCRGPLPNPEKPAVALVGTRRPSAAASMQAYVLGREFARAGITVISGLALGIDALAHRGCLEGGGCTAAVLGSSVDEVYPASNRDLARRILKAGGSLLSEYVPGTRPRKHYYPQRNRIISGLARATVIVEAPAASGALHTARFALDQGRDLFVGSSGLASPFGEGTRRLAQEGCPVISHAAEILAEWGMAPDLDEQNSRNGGSLEPVPEKGGQEWLALSLKKELSL